VVAEGPCAKLSVQAIGQRKFVVFGDTGYELRAWNPGELLAAAQSFVEIREGLAYRNRALLRGLPTNSGGYTPGDIRFGGSSLQHGWLWRTTTHYAPEDSGALFRRTVEAFVHDGRRWTKHSSPDVARFPPAARSLPPLPAATMCSAYGSRLHFVRLTATWLDSGHVWVAGRCQDDGLTNYRETTVLVASGSPETKRWTVAKLSDIWALDAILNVAMYARAADDVYLVAYEPFKPIEKRVQYLVHYDGRSWTLLDTPVGTGMTSVSGSVDGTLWITAGHQLWRRDPKGSWRVIPMPSLLFSKPDKPPSLRITAVRAFAVDDVRVEGAFRVRLPARGEPKPIQGRASVLFHSRPFQYPLFCDPSEPAEKGLSAVRISR